MSGGLSVRHLTMHYRRRLVFARVSCDVRPGQCLGVIGANGAGKTTLLRAMVGLLRPSTGEVRIDGLLPRDALSRTGVAYFAGDATLPGFVRARAWGGLATGDVVLEDRRRLRALSRGTRQLLGLRTVLARQPLQYILLDEPWEGLDPEGARWLTRTLEAKRDRGAGLVLASHRPQELVGLCDAYLLLQAQSAVLVQAHEMAPAGHVTPRLLEALYDRLRTLPDDPSLSIGSDAPV